MGRLLGQTLSSSAAAALPTQRRTLPARQQHGHQDHLGARCTHCRHRPRHRSRGRPPGSGEHIRYLTGHGYLTVASHPDDRRAKTVALTERGWEALDLGERVIADYDTWLAAALGVERVVALRETLHRIIATPRARHRIGGRHHPATRGEHPNALLHTGRPAVGTDEGDPRRAVI